ncbi:MAG: tyrosine-type recombinase/integrase [Actinomycetaceae bacterium]|nr:tyrosine-type recombinase/integrase [Actinomycetaceae bacterium]
MVRILDEAVRDGLIPTNPAKNRAKKSLSRNAFRAQPAEQAPPRAHAIPDMKTLNRPAKASDTVDQSYSDFVMLATLLAARSSEVSGLQVGDVGFSEQPEDQLLVGPKGGVLTTATVHDATNRDKIFAGLGLPDLTRHGLRYIDATWMANAGVPLHVPQDILGHTSVETTRGYLHPYGRHLASAAEHANAFLTAAGQRRHARQNQLQNHGI